jgi:hypothetical protein
MGGNSASRLPRISREHILNAYKAGPDVVVSLIEYLQEQFQGSLDELSNALAELSETNKKLFARIQALEDLTQVKELEIVEGAPHRTDFSPIFRMARDTLLQPVFTRLRVVSESAASSTSFFLRRGCDFNNRHPQLTIRQYRPLGSSFGVLV